MPPPPDQPDPLERWYADYLKRPDAVLDRQIMLMNMIQAGRALFESIEYRCLMISIPPRTGLPNTKTHQGAAWFVGPMRREACRVIGGSHNIAHALIRIFVEGGGKFFANQEVDKIIIENETAKGIRLVDGTEVRVRWIVSGQDPHQLALRIVDSEGLYVFESTVFRILRREGLIKPAQVVGFKAGKEYHRKTRKSSELWATDCAHLKVIDWGWYYLVTVMDGYSRFILAWELKSDMAAVSLIDVIQQAVDITGMTDVPVEDRTALLSDNGSGYLSRQFGEYLKLVGIRHIMAAPYHPQTNGKIERYHRTIKGEINLVPYEMPGELKEAIKAFIDYYNYRRYHEGLGDVTPYDVYTGRHLEIIQRRKEAKNRTLRARRDYNRTARGQGNGLEGVH